MKDREPIRPIVFAKRDRLSRPGKCPVCGSESITDPGFTVQ